MEPGLVIAPRPIRLGEPGYWDHLNDLYSRIGRISSSEDEEDDDDSCQSNRSIHTEGQLHLNLAPTLPTYTECLYTLDGHQRTRLPCECFNSLPPTKCSISQTTSVIRSEFEQDDRLSTTNLIDWQTKESWICDTVRNHVYREMNQSNRWIRLYSSTDFRSTTTTNTTRHQDTMDTDDDEAKAWSSPTSSSSNAIGRYNRSPATTNAYSEDSNSGFTITQRSSESPIFYERSLLSPPLSPTIALPRRTNRNDTKIFKCDQSDCCKRFSRKEELTRHKKTHCSERPFQCEICKRKFNRKDHMTKHQATHQDVSTRRRYLCPSPGCDRCYTRSDALSRHRSSAHTLAHEPGITAFVHRRR